MKQSQFTDLPKLNLYRYENFFNIYTDNNGFKFYNLLAAVNLFPANNSEAEDLYDIKYGDTWNLISYKYYNTMDLWWLICAYNRIINPVVMPDPGTQIKILKANYVSLIINEINKQNSK